MIIHLKALAIAVGSVCGVAAYFGGMVAFIAWLGLPESLQSTAIFLAFVGTVTMAGIYAMALDELRKRAKRGEDSL